MDNKHRNLIGPALAFGLVGLSHTATAVGNTPDPDDGRWHFQLTPYLWLPALNGSASPTVPGLRGGDGRALQQVNLDVDVNPDDYLSSLKMAAMLKKYGRIMAWDVPDAVDEGATRKLILKSLRDALAEVEAGG